MDYESVKYVEGFVENIIFRNEDNGYTVFEIKYKGEDVTCVGTLSSVDTGEFIAADGDFVKHPSYYTMQFKITSYEFKTPTDAESVKRYLSSGAIKGIGAKMAERIVKEFGEQTFEVLDKEPERLAGIKGISYNKAMDIAQQYLPGTKTVRYPGRICFAWSGASNIWARHVPWMFISDSFGRN